MNRRGFILGAASAIVVPQFDVTRKAWWFLGQSRSLQQIIPVGAFVWISLEPQADGGIGRVIGVVGDGTHEGYVAVAREPLAAGETIRPLHPFTDSNVWFPGIPHPKAMNTQNGARPWL